MTRLTIFSPAGALRNATALRLAVSRLSALGFDVSLDEAVLSKHQRFAGDDTTRLAALHRVARQAPSIVLAARGGYGLTRLLDRINWRLLAHSVARGTRWVGYSDMTVLQIAMLAHCQASSWAGPLACDDFGRSTSQGGADDVTQDCFVEAMRGELRAIGFKTTPGHDGLEVRGTLWGGNLSMLNSLLGTRHWPAPSYIRGGVLFLEDVNEHPYRIERSLIQLHQAGVLATQKAVLLGAFSDFHQSPLDRGYTLKTAVAHLRGLTRTPILTGLPFGHVPTKVCLPVGEKASLVVQGCDALLGEWS